MHSMIHLRGGGGGVEEKDIVKLKGGNRKTEITNSVCRNFTASCCYYKLNPFNCIVTTISVISAHV